MKAVPVIAAVILIAGSMVIQAQPGPDMPSKRAAWPGLRRATNNTQAQADYAEFLDRYGDPEARAAYAKLLSAAQHAGDTARAGRGCAADGDARFVGRQRRRHQPG